MDSISKIRLNDTEYAVKDADARQDAPTDLDYIPITKNGEVVQELEKTVIDAGINDVGEQILRAILAQYALIGDLLDYTGRITVKGWNKSVTASVNEAYIYKPNTQTFACCFPNGNYTDDILSIVEIVIEE